MFLPQPHRGSPRSGPSSLVPRTARTLVLLALLAPALSAAGDGASSESRVPPSQGSVVGVLETRAPVVTEFYLRGTLPVPPGTFPRVDGRRPFTVLDFDGTPLVTQTEIASRYAEEWAGADVVELIALAHRDPSVQPGTPLRYSVVFAPPPTPGEAGLAIPRNVRDFVNDPRGIEISTYDCFGNRYVSRPLDGTAVLKVMRHGPVHAEVRGYQIMRPEPAVQGPAGTLPHFFGVHSYLSLLAGQSVIGLDLRFHNGHDGFDRSTRIDDPLDKVYFERIEVSVPAGWLLQQDVQDPFFLPPRMENGRRIYPIVGPAPAERMNVMRWQGQFHRRLAISPSDSTSGVEASAWLNQAGRAFCARGFDEDRREYWSWWNSETARYFPQKQQLPLLGHVGEDALDNELGGTLSFVRSCLENGNGTGEYPISAAALGWSHPYGVSYGGMTSGLEIDAYDGITTAAGTSVQGYRLATLVHRMQTDRMPTALYNRSGEPSSVEQWLVENGTLDYVPMSHYLTPMLSANYPDPFGFRDAPRFQIDFVEASGLQPGYESLHLSFDPHDYQHFVRYTRTAKVLAWLGNDSLAKDDLLMQAENFHLSFHPYCNNEFGNAQSSGLRAMLEYVHSHPGKGFPFGRGEAWGLDCAVAAYDFADLDWRQRKRPWFARIAEMLSDGQAACSGFIQAFYSDKAVGGRYLARQVIEQSITEHVLVGLHESVFASADPVHALLLRDVIQKSLYAFIGEMSWFPGQFGPWRYTGVGPLDPEQAPWCSRAEMPPDAWTDGDVETFQDWCSFAYGYELTEDPEFLRFAEIQMGVHNYSQLVKRLHQDGTTNLENRAALLSLVQRLEGLY